MRAFIISLFLVPMYVLGQSVYTKAFDDPEALHFSKENFSQNADNGQDVSDALQAAINRLKKEKNFGVLYVPKGKYFISKTIHIPKAIRIIGYGDERPEFVLKANSPGFQQEANYMFWFTSSLVEEGEEPEDATAGTFYSAISNVNFRIEEGNPKAIAVRSHFAQHCFVNHCDFYIGDGYAGIYDLGNEVEDLKFYGGQYGISSGRTSPGWPMMMLDLYFEGQKQAAVLSRNTGMTIVSMHVNNAPIAIQLQEGVADRLFMEDCLFENVEKGVVIGVENRASSQINLKNIFCRNVDVPVFFKESGRQVVWRGEQCKIVEFVHGLTMDDMADDSGYDTVIDLDEEDHIPDCLKRVIPRLPDMNDWVNVRDFGAKGDGKTDDTQAIQKAISLHQNIYFPTGWYRVSETIKLNEGNKLIGMHPFATQIMLVDNEHEFSGFGAPVPVVESSEGGNDMINGIGVNTGAYNNRAVALKWMASEYSMVNDVKIIGGHGTMARPGEVTHKWWRRNEKASSQSAPVFERGMDLAWDNQYWSIWITDNGGGIFKDIWTASSYASMGLYISDTSTPGKVYAMSIEHHVRQEARLRNVSGWKFYAFQFEEEGREGKKAQTLNLEDCEDLMFANVWMYRTIRVNTSRPWGVKVSNCRNIEFRNMRSWTQVLQLPEITIYDMDRNLCVYPGDFARVVIMGDEECVSKSYSDPNVQKVGSGYEFATGLVSDSKGNVYFCDHLQKRIYKYCMVSETVSIVADYPYKPLSLSVDTQDNLLVICRYDPQPGYEDNDSPKTIETLGDNNRLYSGWGNGGWAVLVYGINPAKGDDFEKLVLRPTTGIESIERVIHPTHRWRENFKGIVGELAEESFVAPDGVTIVPNTFDLCRSVQLVAVTPNQEQSVYVTDEDHKTTYSYEVFENGRLVNEEEFVPRGEYGNTQDEQGRVYLAEGEVLIFDTNGRETNRIRLEERVQSLAFGGKNKDELFVSTSSSLFKIVFP